jgi:hypothetical protein
MATLGTTIATALAALCAATVLGACGSESGDNDAAADPTSQSSSESPSDSTTEPSPDAGALPECADVWVDGQDLPKDYTACTTDGETIKPVKRACGYGAKFLEQDGRFFAIKGNRITDAGDLETNEDYQQILAACQA